MILDLSIIVAVYNEDPRNLDKLIECLAQTLTPENLSYEIVFVNDGSNQTTSKALRQIASNLEYVKLVELSRNFGQQAAITAGVDHSDGQAVVNIDSDLQDPPELIPEMVKLWREGYDVVYAQRSTRRDRAFKRFTAYWFYRMLGSVSAVQIPSDTGDYRLIDRKVVNELKSLPEKTRYLRGMIPWLGFKQIGIPIDRGAREVGESTYTLRKLFSLAMDGLLTLSVAPLFMVPLIGLILLAAGLVVLFASIFFHAETTDRVFITGALSSFAGAQIFCTGIVAIYLAKVMHEVRGRPTYIVSERLGLAFARDIDKDEQSAAETRRRQETPKS
jgi:dolichol-phosphate mannosyltransferase